jgi:hypothetical protein
MIHGIHHFTSRKSGGSGLYVGLHYRAIGVKAPDGLLWIWIGTHAEYDNLVK